LAATLVNSLLAAGTLLTALPAIAATPGNAALNRGFTNLVHPFVTTYCISCHGGDDPEAGLDLSEFSTVDSVVSGFDDWDLVLEKLEGAEMPPRKAKKHPPPELERQVADWIESMRRNEARKTAGDPGLVTARRLSNAEYDYTIHDLTGVDIRPAREFPVDPTDQAGFDNSGESLAMSPALLRKQLDAARLVADHLVFTPDGFEFAPHPVVTDTDRDKYHVLKIVDFYQHQPTDLADYFAAAWSYRHRAALGRRFASLADIATQNHVSGKYLATVYATLTDTKDDVGPLAKLRAQWRAMPDPSAASAPAVGAPAVEAPVAQAAAVQTPVAQAAAVQAAAQRMRDYVASVRQRIVPVVPNLSAPPIHEGSQTLVLWKDRQMAANRRRFDPGALHIDGGASASEPAPVPSAAASTAAAPAPTAAAQALNDTIRKGGQFIAPAIVTAGSSATAQMAAAEHRDDDPDLVVPADPVQCARHLAAFARFAAVFPDAFYITERARVYLDAASEQKLSGRLLSAGLHSMTGYFRDDEPLYDLVLDPSEQRELDRLWREFYFSASVPQRMHTSFVWWERTDSTFMRDPEFAPFRPEDKSVTDQDKIRSLASLYLAKALANGASPLVQSAIRDHFQRVAADIADVEAERAAAEPRQLRALLAFAARAYRRPLSPAERESLLTFYRQSREADGLDPEDALRDSVAAVLLSPNFSYRMDLSEEAGATSAGHARPAPTVNALPLSDYALASRLSYFLWSSVPDAELLGHAAAGDLHRPAVLEAQTQRMLQDPRLANFAAEFMGHWLDFRRFEEHNAVDRGRFPNFDNALREAMYQEPLHFFTELVRSGAPIQDLLYGDYTFANAPLARLYGIPDAAVPGGFTATGWVRVDHAGAYGRGGLLPMAVFLTANSPGLRTSPVKRGHWFVSNLLGQRIPAPPANVPSLPADEKTLGELTLRQSLEAHRHDPQCAGCHARFDTFGLAMEGYGAIGELRSVDFGGHPVDAHADFPGGDSGTGMAGLRDYIRAHREGAFIDNLAAKLLAYGLGRSLLLSDQLLLDDMKARLAAQHYRFGALVDALVDSPQFRNRRVQLKAAPLAADNRP
jgi:hypothetical protein